MATPVPPAAANATTGFLGEFGAHIVTGLKLVGEFFIDFFQLIWQAMWTGGLATFMIFLILLVFFGIALVKFTFHSGKHLIAILIVLAVVALLTALGLVL